MWSKDDQTDYSGPPQRKRKATPDDFIGFNIGLVKTYARKCEKGFLWNLSCTNYDKVNSVKNTKCNVQNFGNISWLEGASKDQVTGNVMWFDNEDLKHFKKHSVRRGNAEAYCQIR